MSRSAAVRLHQQLADLANRGNAAAAYRDCMAELIRTLIEIHHPVPSISIDTMSCDEHNVTRGPSTWRGDPDYDTCPHCTVTPITVCSSWGCEDYPCETIQAVAAALKLGTYDKVNC